MVTDSVDRLLVRTLGLQDYDATFDAMRSFTASRNASTPDEIWFVQHQPVYTRGVSCKDRPWGDGSYIKLVDSDRGGQITYHGPGQLIAYLMLDLRRRGMGIRQLVSRIECVIVEMLSRYGIAGSTRSGAPGVYIGDAKIAALGLRVRNGCTYHGLSLNVDMDLTPYGFIHPCGYESLSVTQLKDLGVTSDLTDLEAALAAHFKENLGYSDLSRLKCGWSEVIQRGSSLPTESRRTASSLV